MPTLRRPALPAMVLLSLCACSTKTISIHGCGPDGDALASLGMFYIDFVDPDGKPVTPPGGTTVTMGAQAPPVIATADPFNGWTLNAQGNWDDPTALTAPAAAVQAAPAPLPSFGYWNADHAFRTACISGTVQAPSGTCGGARLDLTGPDGIHSTDSSGADGSFCLVGPQGHSGTLNLTGGGNVSFPSQAGNCANPSSCTPIGAVHVSDAQGQTAGGAEDGGVDS